MKKKFLSVILAFSIFTAITFSDFHIVSANEKTTAEIYADVVISNCKAYEDKLYTGGAEVHTVGFMDTDLDGTLEFVVENVVGNGLRLTNIYAYKIDTAHNSLVLMDSDIPEDTYFQISNGLKLYSSDNDMFFVGINSTSSGGYAFNHWDSTQKFFVENNALKKELLFCEGLDDGHEVYYNSLNEGISLTEYNSLKNSFYNSITDMNLKYLFSEFGGFGTVSFKEMSDYEKRDFLLKSYNAFDYDGFDKNSDVKGDIDGDGEITSEDALNILQAVIGLTNLSDKQKSAADLDGDGEITSSDALIVLQTVVGL